MSFRYIAQRVFNSILVVLGVMTILFTLLHISGDPVAAILPPFAPAAQREAVRAELGLDRPLYVQFVDFIARGLRGEFGKSWRHNQPAMGLVIDRLPATVQLAAASLVFAAIFGSITGVVAATRRDSSIDSAAQVGGLLGQCVPGFWLGIVLILVFAVQLRWLPPSGSGSWQHLVLPAITAGFYPAAVIMRLMRSNLLDILSQDYIRTARAKGLARPSVVMSHALRNAAIPVVTFIGLQVAFIMGGLVVVETVFGYPGMGLLTVQAIANRDFPVIQAFVMVMALIILTVNLMVDLTYVWLDPRIRYG